MRHFTVTAQALALLAGAATAEDTIWVRTWMQGQEARSRAIAASGTDIYVAGTTREQFPDILVIKYDAAGDTGWVRTFDIDTMEMAIDIATGSDGRPVVLTRVESAEPAAGLAKVTGTGDTAWVRHLEGTMPSAVAVGEADEVYVWGAAFDSLPMEAFRLARFGASGALEWRKSVRLGDGCQSAGACVDDDGNFVGVGVSFDSLGPNPMVLKFTSNGDTVWTKSLAGLGVDEPLGVAAAAGESLVVTGMAGPEIKVIKLSGRGDTAWTRSVEAMPNPEDINNVAVDGQGEIALYRTSMSGTCELVKLDATGEVVWEGMTDLRGAQAAVCTDSDDRPVTAGATVGGPPAILTIKWQGRAAIGEEGGPVKPRGGERSVILDSNARLGFTVPVAGHYDVRLFDNTGAVVRELHSGRLRSGEQRMSVPGLAAGAYTLRIEGPQGTVQEKVVQVR